MCGMKEIESEIERVSLDEGSSHNNSITNGILPSLGARSNRKVNLHPYIISPFDARYRYMSHLHLCLDLDQQVKFYSLLYVKEKESVCCGLVQGMGNVSSTSCVLHSMGVSF